MRFLITNDDGILAHGIECLVEAAEPLGEVTSSRPIASRARRAIRSRCIIRCGPVQRGERRWQVDGTPTDCVMLAVEALMPERPDFVLSGINHGQNMGEDVLYSGTVAAAMEGLALGIPSIAISFAAATCARTSTHLKRAGDVLTPLLDAPHVAAERFPPNTLLNVNLPPVPADGVQGREAHAAGQPRVLGVAHADEGSVGTRDLLDRRRLDQHGRVSRTPTSARSRRATSP